MKDMKEKRLKRANVIEIIKKYPIQSLTIIAIIALFINIVIYQLISTSNQSNNVEEIVLSEKASGTNLKPKDFPNEEKLLRLLPEFNQFFSLNYLPLNKNEKLKIIVDLFNDDSREKFDDWLSQFEIGDTIEFIFIQEGVDKPLSLSLARAKYAKLIEILPYNSSLFTIKGRFDSEKGVLFSIYYNNDNAEARKKAEEFIISNNLYKESLTIEYFGPFIEGIDSREPIIN